MWGGIAFEERVTADDYAESVMRGFREIDRRANTAIFTGWSSGTWHEFSKCCTAETYVKQSDYYAGYPSCTKCRRSLGPDDLRYEWAPPYKNQPNTAFECPWPTEPEYFPWAASPREG